MPDVLPLSRRSLLGAASVATVPGLLGLTDGSAEAAGWRRPPNIVLILADDLGWGELGCYGQKIIKTPNLDRLAAEGVRFTDYYSAAPICAPSRASLITGRHQGHASIRHNSINDMPNRPQSSLRRDQPSFAQVLKKAGYATGLFGKWGFGPDDRSPNGAPTPGADEGHYSHPLQKGFDEFVGFVYHHHATVGHWSDYWWEGNKRVDIRANANGAKGKYTPDAYTRRGIRFIRRQARADKPFLAWFSTILPHTPNEVPDHSEYDHLPYANDTKKHAAMITRLDTHVGQVVDELERLGIADNTIVLFTSDNGPHDETAVYGGTDPIPVAGVTSAADVEIFDSNGPFRGIKQNLYEGGIRVPMLAWGPGVLAESVQGSVSDHQWTSYDLMATIASLAGRKAPRGTDGISVKPLLRGRWQRAHEYLYWERWRAGAPTLTFWVNEAGRHGHFCQAVRKGRWKLVRWAPGTSDDGSLDVNPTGATPSVPVPGDEKIPKDLWDVELYDLVADPGETDNLAPGRPEVVKELAAHMDAAHTPYDGLPESA